MIKITALNKELEEESRSEEDVTREALEQIALQQYTKALELQRKGCNEDATQLLKDLLNTELLDEVKKPAQGEKIVGPLFQLKYLCYKNLASILAKSDDIGGAIDAYCEAAELDDTDVSLWYRLGLLCLKGDRYEMALNAFQRGVERNPKYWPCLDKIVTLLLGLDYKEECISTIHETLELDPDYLRGLVYKRHIYTSFAYVREFMEYLNPVYKWDEKDIKIDEEKAAKLLKEAQDINDKYLEQLRSQQQKTILPNLKLQKPISQLTWESVGDSLVHMHQHMNEHSFSHACHIEIVFDKDEVDQSKETREEEVGNEVIDNKSKEDNMETIEENNDNGAEISDRDKPTSENEKIESDVEMATAETVAENPPEPKRRAPVRRRGSALSFLEQWEWCNKRRSGRKKPVNRQEDDNIYDTLRRMVPLALVPELVEKAELKDKVDTTVEISEIMIEGTRTTDVTNDHEYFGTENEQKDVKQFIAEFTETKRDIIDLLNNFLSALAGKWKVRWPEKLTKIYVEANKCYRCHIDAPSHVDDNADELYHYTAVNLLVEEFLVNEKLTAAIEHKHTHELHIIEAISIALSLKPQIFTSTDLLEFMLRHLWLKLHVHILNKTEDFALDCLYQLTYEFDIMGEHQQSYNLNVANFTFKPFINAEEIVEYIKFLERNKKLSTVMDLYERGHYEEVLSVTIDSFEHCKDLAKNQEEEMSLDFASQLSLILDSFLALGKVDSCFKWSLICLHEALKHYFRLTSSSPDYDKWTLSVVKILSCIEDILTREGLACIESVSRKELSQGLEDIIRIIGHQVETNAAEMPFGTVVPWIIMHFILQREEDQGRGSTSHDKDKVDGEELPNPLLFLFIAHEKLGERSWCCHSDAKLLYFILDIVTPRLRSPYLLKYSELVIPHMEQCVFCLFGHPGRKNKLKNLVDHNVTPLKLDWNRGQQIYEIFRPPTLPALEGKAPGITADTEILFINILQLLPPECDPQKYVPEMEKYIKGVEENIPKIQINFPYKMRDIFFLLGDYYFKRDDVKLAIKYHMLDVTVNKDRLESWAEISLGKALNLQRLLNSCKNLNNEREYLNPAKFTIRCFKRSLELDPTYNSLWIEYGVFVYTVHSFCSRLLKQASESLSMDDFEFLERQKEDMLETTQKSFLAVISDMCNSSDAEKPNEESWLNYYMLGKVAEKQNKPPSVYLDYYMQGVKSLQEADATYPLKINYGTPTRLCIEVLELHYRIHASILKYIEQHENKPIPASVGKVFSACIEEWKQGPFTKKPKKDGLPETESTTTSKSNEPPQAANIFKRSISDVGEDETHESKKLKQESAAAKVKRSASYDTERFVAKETKAPAANETPAVPKESEEKEKEQLNSDFEVKCVSQSDAKQKDKPQATKKDKTVSEKKRDSTSSGLSSSSTGTSSESSSDSTSDTSRDGKTGNKPQDSIPLTDEEIMKIVGACLDALEDCASRFPPHYKAIYRLAHYHFYYNKGKDIERCRDLMLSTFISRTNQKLGGLFSERKQHNFFNNIWKIPCEEVDRGGGFAFHMNRSVLLTMEILKEIDDHKTLLDLSLHLQRTPEPGKKYLRDSDREELAQQAFSLCVQSLKGQLFKFSQQADLKSNEIERQALKSLMLDIYRAYQRAQKQPNSKQFTNLLVEAYKLVSTIPITESMNLVDLSMKYCQAFIQTLKQQATQASIDKSQNAQKKQTAKTVDAANTKAGVSASTSSKPEPKPSTAVPAPPAPVAPAPVPAAPALPALPALPGLPKFSSQDMSALLQSYIWTNQSMAGYNHALGQSLQNTLHNSFQAEFFRQFLEQTMSAFNPPPPKKQKRGPKPGGSGKATGNPAQSKSSASASKPFAAPLAPVGKAGGGGGGQKSAPSPLLPTMGTVLATLPAGLAASLAPGSLAGSAAAAAPAAHQASSAPAPGSLLAKPPPPHHHALSGKTLQEKLAERQKNLPAISKSTADIAASINKLPSSVTVTKTSVPRLPPGKKPDAKRPAPARPKPPPPPPDEVIVLDD